MRITELNAWIVRKIILVEMQGDQWPYESKTVNVYNGSSTPLVEGSSAPYWGNFPLSLDV